MNNVKKTGRPKIRYLEREWERKREENGKERGSQIESERKLIIDK